MQNSRFALLRCFRYRNLAGSSQLRLKSWYNREKPGYIDSNDFKNRGPKPTQQHYERSNNKYEKRAFEKRIYTGSRLDRKANEVVDQMITQSSTLATGDSRRPKKLPYEGWNFDDDENDNLLASESAIYDQAMKDEARIKKEGWKQNVKRTYFKQPGEPNLLTWAAKEQIWFLNESDPELWTPEKLAESFPASVTGIKKVIRNKFTPDHHEEEFKRKHDLDVLDRWKKLAKGESIGPISTAVEQLYLSGRMSILTALGNPNLPAPLADEDNIKMDKVEKPVGPWTAIVKDYVEKKKLANTSVDGGTEVLASILSQTNSKSGKYLSASDFTQQLKEQFASIQIDNSVLGQYKAWLSGVGVDKGEAPPPVPDEVVRAKQEENLRSGPTMVRDKFVPAEHEEVADNLTLDVKVGSKSDQPDAYLYSADSGYQTPLGTAEGQPPEQIEADPEQDVRQIGDSFYDKDGALLYRVPGINTPV